MLKFKAALLLLIICSMSSSAKGTNFFPSLQVKIAGCLYNLDKKYSLSEKSIFPFWRHTKRNDTLDNFSDSIELEHRTESLGVPYLFPCVTWTKNTFEKKIDSTPPKNQDQNPGRSTRHFRTEGSLQNMALWAAVGSATTYMLYNALSNYVSNNSL